MRQHAINNSVGRASGYWRAGVTVGALGRGAFDEREAGQVRFRLIHRLGMNRLGPRGVMEEFGRLMNGMKTMVVMVVTMVRVVNGFRDGVLGRLSLGGIPIWCCRSVSGISDGNGTEGDGQYDCGS